MLHTATPHRASAYGEQGNVYLIVVVLVAVRYRRAGGVQHADTQRLMCTSLEAAVSVLPLAIIPSCTIVAAKIMRILFTTKKTMCRAVLHYIASRVSCGSNYGTHGSHGRGSGRGSGSQGNSPRSDSRYGEGSRLPRRGSETPPRGKSHGRLPSRRRPK